MTTEDTTFTIQLPEGDTQRVPGRSLAVVNGCLIVVSGDRMQPAAAFADGGWLWACADEAQQVDEGDAGSVTVAVEAQLHHIAGSDVATVGPVLLVTDDLMEPVAVYAPKAWLWAKVEASQVVLQP